MTPPNSEPVPTDRDSRRVQGQAIRQARASRARSIRRRVIAGAASLFAAAWLMITVSLISGNDPALASKAATAAKTTQAATSSATNAAVTSTSAATPQTTTTTAAKTTTTTPANNTGTTSSVTTRQS